MKKLALVLFLASFAAACDGSGQNLTRDNANNNDLHNSQNNTNPNNADPNNADPNNANPNNADPNNTNNASAPVCGDGVCGSLEHVWCPQDCQAPNNDEVCKAQSECGTEACVAGRCQPCEASAQCGEGLVCVEAQCVSAGCASQEDCDEGLACRDGQCVEVGPVFMGDLCAGCARISSERYTGTATLGAMGIEGPSSSAQHTLQPGILSVTPSP